MMLSMTSDVTTTGASSSAPVVVVRRGCVTFDGDCVVDEVNLTVERGEFIAILGDNGSGKTTLIRAILGLTPLSHGTVELFGTVIGQFRQWQRVAYVPQRLIGTSSVPVSVLEAVRAARLRPRRLGPLGRADRAAVRDALEHVGLWERRHDRLDELSGGQQRRVMIARALAVGADLLVLDEPTAGVDASNQQRLADVLASLRAAGITVLLVTHELGPLADLVTRVVIVAHPQHGDDDLHRGDHGLHGSVIYDGPPPGPVAIAHPHHHHEELGLSHSHPPLVDASSPLPPAGDA